MDRDELRDTISAAVGHPASGPVADAVDAITDAVLDLAQPRAAKPSKETRVVAVEETRDEEAVS